MNPAFRAALVIARRDYVASVWSRAFIFFLIGPLIPIIFGVTFGSVGAKMQRTELPPVIAIIAPPAEGHALVEARLRVTRALGGVVPEFTLIPPAADVERQSLALIAKGEATAVLSGLPDKPVLRGSRQAIRAHGPEVEWIVSEAWRDAALDHAGIRAPAAKLTRVPVSEASRPVEADRSVLARASQLLLLFLTMILAGLLLSNLLEEKSNKVIEILAAAVPVDAIFMGKLIAMLGMSLTGITIWSTAAVAAIAAFAPDFAVNVPEPGVGWPIFVLLGFAYFISSYLLIGALFLGIGGQANTVREVQTLSMPLTFGQLVVYGFATAVIEQPNGAPALLASIFPWSSPYAMIGRAALLPELWPHLIALAWHAVAVTAIIRISARLFRSSVLKSGGRRKFWKRISGRSSRAA
jgi:ABC-2 type transport system permease protein